MSTSRCGTARACLLGPYGAGRSTTIGLRFDPHARREFHDLVHRLVGLEGARILLTTHDLDEAERLADRILIPAGGRIAADACPDEVARRVAADAGVRRHEPAPALEEGTW